MFELDPIAYGVFLASVTTLLYDDVAHISVNSTCYRQNWEHEIQPMHAFGSRDEFALYWMRQANTHLSKGRNSL